MKTKFLAFLMICFFANITMAQKVIKPADLKVANLATFLKSKGYNILEQEETFLKISDTGNNNLFIDVDPGNKYLHLNVKILLKAKTKRDKIDKLMTDINGLDMISARYIESDNSVFFQYFFWMTNGFTYETLEDAVMEFLLYQGDSYALDEDKIFDYAD